MIPELSESINELQEMVEFSNSIKHFTPKANRKIVSTHYDNLIKTICFMNLQKM